MGCEFTATGERVVKMNRFKKGIPTVPTSLAILALTLVLGAGCGNDSVKLTSSESKVFDSAPAEVKQAWEKALAADKANDYTNAQSLLDSLQQMQLNDDQKQALEKERTAFGQRVWAAAEKNDPAAVKVIQTQNSRRRNAAAPAK
jgi:hypothetical protein